MVTTAEVLLKYKTDEQSAKQASERAKKLRDEMRQSAGVGGAGAKSFAEAEKQYLRMAEQVKAKALEEAKLISLGTQALQAKATAIQNEIKANNQAIDILKKSGVTASNVAKKIEEYTKANQRLEKTLTDLTQNIIPKAAEAEARSRQNQQPLKDLKDVGGGLRDFAQITAAIGVLSGSEIGQNIANIIALGDALKSFGGIKAGIQGLASVLISVNPIVLGVGAALLGVTTAFSVLNKELEKARQEGEAYGKLLAEQSKTNADARVALSKGDTDAVLRQLKELQDTRLSLLLEDQENQRKLNELIAQREQYFNPQLGVFNELLRSTSPDIQYLDSAIAQLEQSIKSGSDEMVSTAIKQAELTQLLREYGFTTEQIEQAIAELDKPAQDAKGSISELTQELLKLADATRNRFLEEARLLQEDEQSLKSRADAIRTEIEANNKAIEILKQSGDTSEEVTKKIKEYEQANVELGKTLDFINNTALPQANARAREAQRQADIERTNQDIINATKKYNDDRKRLEEDYVKDLYSIERRRTETLKQIADAFAKESARALERYNDELQKNRDRYNEQEYEARQKALEADADALKNHYRNIQDIYEKAHKDELDALGNLDFKRAFEIRRGINNELAENQKKFTRDAQDRAEAQSRERAERLRAYARAQADAQINYQKELALANENRVKALAEAKASYQRELAELQNSNQQKQMELQKGYAKELELAKLTGEQRLALQKRQDAELLAQAQAFLRQLQQPRPATPLPLPSRPSPSLPITPSPQPRPIGVGTPKPTQPPVINVTVNGAGNPRQVARQIVELTRGGKTAI